MIEKAFFRSIDLHLGSGNGELPGVDQAERSRTWVTAECEATTAPVRDFFLGDSTPSARCDSLRCVNHKYLDGRPACAKGYLLDQVGEFRVMAF